MFLKSIRQAGDACPAIASHSMVCSDDNGSGFASKNATKLATQLRNYHWSLSVIGEC